MTDVPTPGANPESPGPVDPTPPPRQSRLRRIAPDTRALQIPAYRRLFLGQAVTVVGSQLTVVAVQQQIFDLTGSSAWVGAASFVALIPLITFGLLGGAIADTHDRRVILVLSSTGIALTSIGLWVNAIIGGGSVVVVFAMLALQQGLFAVNSPARGAIIPRLVPADLVPGANALSMTVFSVGVLLGPLLAGVLLPTVGLGWLYLIDAIGLTAVVWAAYRLPPMPRQGPARERAKVGEGLRYLRGRDVLLLTFVVDILAMVLGMPRALFPQMAEQTFGGPAEGGIQLGLLNLGLGLGAAIGGLTGGWIQRVRRQGLAIIVAIVVWGLAMVGFGLSTSIWIAVGFLAVGGWADMVSAVYRTTVLQLSATDEMRGRMQGVFLVVVAGGPRVADLLHGLAAEASSTTLAVTGGGVLVVVTVLIVAFVRPALIRYRAEDALQK
ncbi:MFS transporter [Nakamurella deserti]|uniref:MFS transporter n=1 Tax=Nakamurella deserti TaxID=2164074 RepID=UPI000DBE384A|nr:MFS transporter [Nakamurella deserti]